MINPICSIALGVCRWSNSDDDCDTMERCASGLHVFPKLDVALHSRSSTGVACRLSGAPFYLAGGVLCVKPTFRFLRLHDVLDLLV